MNLIRMIMLCIPLFLATRTCATATDIIDLHQNSESGRPAAPFNIGAVVTIEGVVTLPQFVFSATTLDVYVQDSTGGINIISNTAMPLPVLLGQRVRVSGAITQLYGHTKIKDPTGWEIVAEKDILPLPRIITCAELTSSFLPDFSEPNESRLVRINGVTVQQMNGDLYTIADSTASALLYRDPDAALPAPPAGAFDVIGVVRQYDTTTRPPVKNGYQISPRFASDLISRSGPLLLRQPVEASISPRSLKIAWTTDTPATSVFKYKQREASAWQTLGDSTRSTGHSITLPNLHPVTLYQGYAVSSDGNGSVASREFLFMTASERSCGSIAVYFNRSVNTAYAWRDAAQGQTDLSKIIIARIDQAKYSLDVHYYSFTHDDIATALINAKKRGLSVRFICDALALAGGNYDIDRLRNAGIPVISDTFGNNDGEAASHNKFIIIDHRDHSEGSDDYLWTGSANASYAGATGNGENMLLIQDESLCAAYTIEFNEMWGSDTDTPNYAHARFGAHKTDNTPHRFNIGGIMVEQYMSPSDRTEERIVDAINSADHDINFCILTFTQESVANAMKSRFLRQPGFSVRGVFDRSDALNNSASEYASMAGTGSRAWMPAADVHLDGLKDRLHHKYILIDAGYPDSDPLVITGSHNWSRAANTVNDENTLIIHDRRIANLYLQEFVARYQEAGGGADIASPVERTTIAHAPRRFQLRQNYPNPFNATTTVTLFIPANDREKTLRVFDINGREVSRMAVPAVIDAWCHVVWEGRDQHGKPLPSGLYWAVREGHDATDAIKMLLIR